MNKKVCFILPTLGQPRFTKRVDSISERYKVERIFSFQRNYHSGSKIGSDVVLFGEITKGRYISRFFSYFKALKRVKSEIKDLDVLYVFGADLAFLAYLASIRSSCKVVVEIGDIREIQVSNSLVSKVYRAIEKFVLAKIDLLVLTSEKFKTEFFERNYKLKNIVVLENKVHFKWFLDGYYERRIPDVRCSRRIRIGYFGLLRCSWSANCLLYLLKNYSRQFELLIAGFIFDAAHEFQELVSLDNVRYFGEYKNPEHVSEIYNEIDIVWGAYKPIQSSDHNLKWARTNRFNEAAVFGKPIILRQGSQDAIAGALIGNALIISDEDEIGCATRLSWEIPFKLSDLESTSRNINAIDYTTHNQDTELLSRIEKLFHQC